MLITIILIITILALVSWWLLIRTEGVYLGRRVVIWLYDVYARRYDTIKEFNPNFETAYLGRPLMTIVPESALILDVATGTGRLPDTLFHQRNFQGQVIGVDLSRKMLRVAAEKLRSDIERGRVTLFHCAAEELPFPDDSFDMAVCLEALEFMVSPKVVLAEITRVTRAGGVILLTNRQGLDAKLMPGKTLAHDRFKSMLESAFDLEIVEFNEYWTMDYALIWTKKKGQAPKIGIQPVSAIVRCPQCKHVGFSEWQCLNCGHKLLKSADGVIEGVV